MLARRTGWSEPRVVGNVHKDSTPVQGELSNFVGEDRLIADKRTEPDSARGQRAALCAASERPDLFCERLGKRDELLERNELAEGHQVNLVVALDPGAIGSDERRRVEDVRLAVAVSGMIN